MTDNALRKCILVELCSYFKQRVLGRPRSMTESRLESESMQFLPAIANGFFALFLSSAVIIVVIIRKLLCLLLLFFVIIMAFLLSCNICTIKASTRTYKAQAFKRSISFKGVERNTGLLNRM